MKNSSNPPKYTRGHISNGNTFVMDHLRIDHACNWAIRQQGISATKGNNMPPKGQH
jgi:hypothetical protein